jgi:carbon-monoxide dehydrogenase medium subunit
MGRVTYHRARSLEEAIATLAAHGADARPLAGGTALVPALRRAAAGPVHLVDLHQVAELHGIRPAPGGGLEVGALTTLRAFETASAVAAYCPELARPFARVATVRVRNQGTLGGNLALGDPAHDPPPALLALDAAVVLAGPTGYRSVPLGEFFLDRSTTCIALGEILIAVRLPALPAGTRLASLAHLSRTGGADGDYATVSVAVSARLDADGRCVAARVALGSVAPVPLRVPAAEDALVGQHLSADAARSVADLVVGQVEPSGDHLGSADYKRAMAGVWTERALRRLIVADDRRWAA